MMVDAGSVEDDVMNQLISVFSFPMKVDENSVFGTDKERLNN